MAIREIALNSRKEYSADEYDSLKWTATIFMYIGWIMMLATEQYAISEIIHSHPPDEFLPPSVSSRAPRDDRSNPGGSSA
jgi:hypothetical protein